MVKSSFYSENGVTPENVQTISEYVAQAEAAKDAAEAAYADFDIRYLGAKTSAPSTDNNGGTLATGALYYNTTSNIMFVWDGVSWESAVDSVAAAEAAQAAAEAAQAAAELAETNASTSETNAASSAASASSSASAAASSASSASSNALSAATAATNAAISAASAATSYDDFDDRYLGAKTSNPTVDNDGDPLIIGALYWNSTSNNLRVYDGASWNVYSATGAPVDSVNGQTGVVVLDADDISDGVTTNKFTTAAEISKLAGIEAGADVTDAANVAAAGAVMDVDFSANGLMQRTGAGTYTTKTAPSGDVVGTTDTQTISNKTISSGTFTGTHTGPFTLTDDMTVSGNLAVNGASVASGSAFIVKSDSTGSADWSIICRDSVDANLFAVRSDGFTLTGTSVFSPYNNTSGAAANLVVTASGGLSRSTSSMRYKTNVSNMKYGLNEVLSLRPVTYSPKPTGTNHKEIDNIYGGLIAEEVHKVGLRAFVAYNEKGEPDSLHYGQMVSLAFKAIQEQQQIIKELKSRIEALETKKI